jgi:hypothetical protein
MRKIRGARVVCERRLPQTSLTEPLSDFHLSQHRRSNG